jgi:hypothetical protein
MIAIKIFDNGNVETEEVNREENAGWMTNKNIGGYWSNNYKVILLDGEKKRYHLLKKVNRMTKEIDEEIKKLQLKKNRLLTLLDLDIE